MKHGYRDGKESLRDLGGRIVELRPDDPDKAPAEPAPPACAICGTAMEPGIVRVRGTWLTDQLGGDAQRFAARYREENLAG